MPTVDPVILQLKADVDSYNANVSRAQKLTDQKLGAIEARGLAMGKNLKKGFDLAKGAAIGYAASIGVSTVVNAIEKGLEYASSLGEVAQQLGVTTNALQEYRYAGSQAGLATEETDQALSQLTRRIGEAASGTKAQAEAFAKLGISVKDANGDIIDAGRAIPLIADALQKVESPAERAAILMDLFGRAGQKLEPLLAGGASAVNGLRDAAHSLGIVLSEEQIQNADKTADKLSALKQVLEARIAGVVSDNADGILQLAGALGEVANAAGRAATEVRRFQALGGQVREAAKYVNPFASSADRTEAARRFRLYGEIKNSPDAKLPTDKSGSFRNYGAAPFIFKPNKPGSTKFAGGDTVGGGSNLARALAPSSSGKGVGNLAALGALPAEAVKASTDISIELQQLAADLASVSADLSGSLEDRAKAERLRLDAELASDNERVRQRDDIDDAVKTQLISQNSLIDAKKREVIAANLTADLAEQSSRAEEDALRQKLAARGPGEVFLDDLKKDAAGLADNYEEIAIRGLGRIEDGLTRTVSKALGLHGALGDIVGDLIQMFIRFAVILPLAQQLFGAQAGGGGGGGGLFGSILSGIGTALGAQGGRASGGYVAPGKTYRVNEGASPGRVEAFMSRDGGKIIPLGQMNALQRGGAQQGGMATVRLELSGDIDARIQRVSGPVAVQVVRATAPELIDLAAKETLSRAGRPRV